MPFAHYCHVFFLLKLILCAYVCRMCVGYGCACTCTHECEWRAECTMACLWSSEDNLRRQPSPCIPSGMVPAISSLHLPSPCISVGIINTHTWRNFCIGSEGSNSANTFPHIAIFLPNIILMLFFLIHKHSCYLLSQQWSLISTHAHVAVAFSTFHPFLHLIISFKMTFLLLQTFSLQLSSARLLDRVSCSSLSTIFPNSWKIFQNKYFLLIFGWQKNDDS